MRQSNKTLPFYQKKSKIYQMKVLIIFLYSMFLLSCGVSNFSTARVSVPEVPTISDETLILAISEFEVQYDVKIGFQVSFVDDKYFNNKSQGSQMIIGVCEIFTNNSRRVLLNKNWWEIAEGFGIYSRKLLLNHELGHCLFGRGHETKTYTSGMPKSIMYPSLSPILSYYNDETKYYYDTELNNPSRSLVVSLPQKTAQYFMMKDGSCLDQ